MRVARWGNSLAVRLPAEVVRELDLKEGDDIDLHAGEAGLVVARRRRPDEILAALRRFRGRLPADARLSRDEANAR